MKNTVRPRKIPFLDSQRDSHATSHTAIYANITQTGRIRVYCRWFWVVLVGFVGGFGSFWLVLLVVLGRFGWFWLVPCFSNYVGRKELLLVGIYARSYSPSFECLNLSVDIPEHFEWLLLVLNEKQLSSCVPGVDPRRS